MGEIAFTTECYISCVCFAFIFSAKLRAQNTVGMKVY